MTEPNPTVAKVLMSRELMEQWASRDIEGNRLRWDWGRPDADGFYVPTVTVDRDDNAAANERERLLIAHAEQHDDTTVSCPTCALLTEGA